MFKQLLKAIFPLTIGLVSGLGFWQNLAQAQVTVSPLFLELETRRSQAEGIFEITNDGDTPFRGRVYTEPFTYSRDGGFQTLEESANDLSPYLRFSQQEFTIDPGDTRKIRLIVTLSPDLPEGEYRTAIFAEKLEETTTNNPVNIRTRIAVTVYVYNGDLSPNLAITEAQWNREEQQIQVLVNNTGTATARPGIEWELRQNGEVVTTGNVTNRTVMAQGDRFFLLENPNQEVLNLRGGEYQLTGELIWSEDNYRERKTEPFNINLSIPSNSRF